VSEETSCDEGVQCPYCQHIHRDSWELDDDGLMDCEQCEREIVYSRNTTITYTAHPPREKGERKL
jgi:hypothetical protein